jgi:hypothetical protein
MKNKYRIVRDAYLGYEAQVKFWWFPFVWWQMNHTNTHGSVEQAREFIEKRRHHVVEKVP